MRPCSTLSPPGVFQGLLIRGGSAGVNLLAQLIGNLACRSGKVGVGGRVEHGA